MTRIKEIQKKILMLGDGSVGKTSLIRRFVVDKFDDRYIATIGTKITAKSMQIERDGTTTYLKLQIWDILGQKGYKKLYQSSFRGVDGVFLVYDITRKETLDSIKEYWIPEVQSIAGLVPFVILANKSDLMKQAIFDEKNIREFSSQYKIPYYLTSAKNGDNVTRAFEILGKRMIKHRFTEPQKFRNPNRIEMDNSGLAQIIDMIIADFCKDYGGLEEAMPILRKQFENAQLDISRPAVSTVRRAVDKLATFEITFKDKEIAESNRKRRLRWIDEIA